MKRIERLTIDEYNDAKVQIKSQSENASVEAVLEEMPSYLFGIALEYGFNDTEVRDWMYVFITENYINQKE